MFKSTNQTRILNEFYQERVRELTHPYYMRGGAKRLKLILGHFNLASIASLSSLACLHSPPSLAPLSSHQLTSSRHPLTSTLGCFLYRDCHTKTAKIHSFKVELLNALINITNLFLFMLYSLITFCFIPSFPSYFRHT